MSTTILTPKEEVVTTIPMLKPTDELVKAATLRSLKGPAFKGTLAETDITNFLTTAVKASPIQAKADLIFVLFYGNITCRPTSSPWNGYHMDEDAWGIGGSALTTLGFMYTAYDAWDAFFKLTTSYHAQGIADAGGFLQINWFNHSGTPIGQYNAAAGGIGVFECGGRCTWKR